MPLGNVLRLRRRITFAGRKLKMQRQLNLVRKRKVSGHKPRHSMPSAVQKQKQLSLHPNAAQRRLQPWKQNLRHSAARRRRIWQTKHGGRRKQRR